MRGAVGPAICGFRRFFAPPLLRSAASPPQFNSRSAARICRALRQIGDMIVAARSYLRRVTRETNAFGELGERIAVRWLEKSGWKILARRFRSGRRDIDVVAERDGLIAFVEVKARNGSGSAIRSRPFTGENSGNSRNRLKPGSIGTGRVRESYRFDVMGVLVQDRRVYVRHVPGAFQLQ